MIRQSLMTSCLLTETCTARDCRARCSLVWWYCTERCLQPNFITGIHIDQIVSFRSLLYISIMFFSKYEMIRITLPFHISWSLLWIEVINLSLNFRNQSLHMVLQNWKQGALISREEHEMNLVQSQEHWKKNQLQHCFVHWHDLLLTERAILSANHKLTRSVRGIYPNSINSSGRSEAYIHIQ